MNNKKKIIFVVFAVIVLVSALSVVACSPARRPEPVQPAPNVPTPSPTAPTPNAPVKDDAMAEKTARKISNMEGINSATVVFSGNKAWVGVDMAANVEDKLTDKTKNEITKLVKMEDAKVDTVYVTADADIFSRLKNIANDIANGKPITGFVNELNEIGRRVVPSVD